MKSPKFRVLLAVAGHLARAKLQDRPQARISHHISQNLVLLSRGAEEQGSRGAEEQRSRGAGEQGSRGAGEQGSRGAGEQGSKGELLYKFFPLCPSAPLHFKLVRNAGKERGST
ncbi:hypothetical protein [Nostoc sp.]|uniref:hypothetical protein n=1 Tax=Nostoc sp. TaxID=1180 RepID=UPI002FF52273